MKHYFDIFNSSEQISRLDKAIAKADRVTAFLGYFLTSFLTVSLLWQYFLR